MKCPKCGYELTEGHLYCDSCGEEIRIVPDFEPEIEKEMTETLSTLFVELAKEEIPELPSGHKKEEGKAKPARSYRLMVTASLCFAFIAIICIAGNFLYRTYSISYQLDKAKECAALEKYTQAIGYLERAYALDNEDADILFLMADYYYIEQKYDFAVYSLQQIIGMEDIYIAEDVESAYDKIIAIYREQNDYEAINKLLLSCTDENIVTAFQQYIAKPPEFSYVEGNYDEVLPLKLSANTSGKIYYTLDGSRPNEKSEVYTAPIFLETGTYTVTAYFVNDYGIKSDLVSNVYRIDLMVPTAPEVSVYSGDYYEPYLIEADAAEGCTIYYTIDSTDPTADSLPYTAPISMPLGKSVYKFIAVSPEGVSSDITIRTYRLTLQTDITVDMAVSNVIRALIREDVLLDEQGSMRGTGGRNVYKYNAVSRIGDSGDYYIIYEYFEDTAGIQTRTDRIYGVNILDGSAWRVTYNDEGQIILIPLE